MSTAQRFRIPPIAPVPRRPLYQLGQLFTAILVLLLPLSYVGLIVLTGFGVYYHATANLFLVQHHKVGAVLYVAGLMAGSTLAFVLSAPVVMAFGGRRERQLTVNEAQAPSLFQLVRTVAAAVGADEPNRIEINCTVNAAAALDSIFARRSTLVLGLPLLSVLTVQQFAGVLAHEFGHFRQGAGRRLRYLIGWVQTWLDIAANYRGRLDHTLQGASQKSNSSVQAVIAIVRGAMWMARAVLRFELAASRVLVQFMTRQMEFDADRYEVRLAGFSAFETTTHLLPVANFAFEKELEGASILYEQGRLPDNLPELTQAAVLAMGEEQRQVLRDWGLSHNTAMYDSHPSSRDRLASARQEHGAGVLTDSRRALELLENHEQACREVTLRKYESLGIDVSRFEICDWREQGHEAKRRQNAAQAKERLLGEFFGSSFFMFGATGVASQTTSMNAESAMAMFREQKAQFDEALTQDITNEIGVSLGTKTPRERASNALRAPADAAAQVLLLRIKDLFARTGSAAEAAQRVLQALEQLSSAEPLFWAATADAGALDGFVKRLFKEGDADSQARLEKLRAQVVASTARLIATLAPMPCPLRVADPTHTVAVEIELDAMQDALAEKPYEVSERVCHNTQWLNSRLLNELAYELDKLGADWDLRAPTGVKVSA